MPQHSQRTSSKLLPLGLAAVLLLVGAMALPLLAQPPGDGPGFERDTRGHRGALPVRLLARALDLTEQQIEDTRAIAENLEAAVRPLHEEGRALHQELRSILEGASPDPTTVGNLVLEIDALRDEGKAAKDAAVAQFETLLTPEQLEKFQLLQEMWEDRPRKGRRGGHRAGPSRG